ncbi:MAG: hypothetical protein QF645_03710, partial [Planctomycetota bacterium]|nr:hypothetical protein [Planctomycetota bacterium]
TVDGVSLTINKVVDSVSAVDIEANIVPHTLAVTTLGELQNGGRVHIEVDLRGSFAFFWRRGLLRGR